MLNQPKFQLGSNLDDAEVAPRTFQNPLSGFDIIGAARRQIWVLVGSVVVTVLLALLFILQAIPTYTSSATILIDAKNVGMTASSPLEGSLTFETGAVDSQLQILMSDKLASNVAQRLGLQNNIAFIDPEGSALSRLFKSAGTMISGGVRLLTGAPQAPAIKDLPEGIRLLLASNILQNRLDVERVGRTYVLTISYTDPDPILAQSITGQYANAYLEDQLDSKFESTRRATNWMEERIRDLKSRSLAADQAVQKYRADNNLTVASGRLIDEQSLTDATTLMTSARSNLDTASARYQRLKQIVETQDVNSGLTESLSNPNVASLRAKYTDAAKLASEIAAKYGDSHQAAVKARKDMEEYKRLIFDELKNLVPAYQSDVAIAQSNVDSIQRTIDQFRQTSNLNDSAMVKLRALEQESDTLKTLYSNFLQKSQELQQQQSFPVTDARVISDASVPLLPTSPKKLLVVVAALVLGGMIGAGIGLLREWRDRGFRTAAQVRDELGLEFIANVPALVLKKLRSDRVLGRDTERNGAAILTISTNPVLQKVVDEPFSQFSESIRALRSKIGMEFPRKKGIVIGMVSMFPDEGKSTIAKNLASSLALQGSSTILIDGDLRNPNLTHSLLGSPRYGLVDVLNGHPVGPDVLAVEHGSGLSFLPGATKPRQANDVFGSDRVHELMEILRRQYDVIVIDFPPVGALTDAISANSLVDGYFFVAQWGRTPRNLVKEFVFNHPHMADKILGVVLNKVDLKKLGKYGAYQSTSDYTKYNMKYFSSATS